MSSWFWNVKKWGEVLRWPSAGALMQSVLFSLTKQMLSLGTLKQDHHFLMQLVQLKSGILLAPLGEPKGTLFSHVVLRLPEQSHSPANVPQPGLQKPACASAYIWEGLLMKAALGTSKNTLLHSESLPNTMNVRWDKYTVRHDILPAPSQRIIENTKLPSKDVCFVMW